MNFRYRFVGFGTYFSTAKGARSTRDQDPSTLHENELAMDVGGNCWGHAGVDDHVIDHHFHRADRGQFPSAAAAVLHLAGRIADRFGRKDGDLWLVTHRDPDFDAFCSMYLVRCLLDGTIPAQGWEALGLRPDGWYQGRDEIDWFCPRLDDLPPERRWPILLAAYAACVDNGRRLACPRNRSLHSVLYSAMLRGRDYRREHSGALEFFEEVQKILAVPQQGLNPLIDSVLEQSATFAPELAMLDREVESYRHDLRRGRRVLVFLQESTVPFQEWFPHVQGIRLLSEDGSPEPIHLRPPNQGRSQVDGIYLRDPECLLFKEWARLDTEHSTLGQGFLFTAVAYSRGRPEARVNQTDYFFSIDPERAGRRHLYNVWARLQAGEVRALFDAEAGPSRDSVHDGVARRGFEGRAAGCEAYFTDPWFDGHNYACTIIATPNQGTTIAAGGTASDLSDDRIAQFVQQELEHSVFTSSEATIEDLSASAAVDHLKPHTVPIAGPGGPVPPPRESYYRFGQVALEDHVDTLKPAMARQIGRVLWDLLDSDGSEGPAEEALDQHFVADSESVAVWSRRGIVVAVKERSAARADEIKRDFKRLAALARAVEYLVKMGPGKAGEGPKARRREAHGEQDEVDRLRRKRIRVGETLMRRVAQLRHRLALPQARLVRNFFEANHLSQVLEMARSVNLADFERTQTARMDENIKTVADVQKTVHWIETFVVAVYAVELFHVLGVSFGFRHEYIAWGVVFAAAFTVMSIALVLHPWRHGGASRGMIGFLIAMAIILAGFVTLGKLKYPGDEPSHGGARSAPTHPDGSGPILPAPP